MNAAQRHHARDARLTALSAQMGHDDPASYLWDAYVLWREQEYGPAAHIHRALRRGTAYAHARSLEVRGGEYVNPLLRELDRLTR